VIEFIRSTPLLIQVYFLYYVLPNYGVSMTAMQVGILGIGLHYACYIAEVYRGGLDAVPRAQWEAVTALNIAPYSAYRNIILPQALRPILPPLGNYLVAMLKDTLTSYAAKPCPPCKLGGRSMPRRAIAFCGRLFVKKGSLT